MRILKKTQIDFLGKRRIAFVVSTALIGLSLVTLIMQGGPRQGIDFAGGSQVIVRFAAMPDINAVRSALEGEGLEPLIQEFGEDSNELLIRTPGLGESEQIDTAVRAVTAGLERFLGTDGDSRLDLNTVDPEEVASLLIEMNPAGYDLVGEPELARANYLNAVAGIFELRDAGGLLDSWDRFAGLGLDPAIAEVVKDNTRFGGYAVIDSESVGPQVGQDLRRQTVQAIVWALLGMLAYISYRFEFKFGVGAVVALTHDVLIVLGAFAITGREFNLPVVAAFLTIVGYSLNDTVVVFDRIRENGISQRKLALRDRINLSLNQTLSRTLLTSTTTLIVVASLFLYGGPVINDFSFALLVGVLVGTYSSLFVASPIVYLWQKKEAVRTR